MFTVVAERINMTRQRIRQRVWERDAAFIRREAERQTRAGATHIDVNAGGDPAKEVEDMIWLVETVAAATSLPLSLDSANPRALEEGLKRCNRPGTIINSITGEKDRLRGILPLVAQYGTGVIALTMDDSGMPETTDGRLRITRDLVRQVTQAGVGLERVYFDHLIRPASTNPGQARSVLEAIAATRREFPAAHIAMGLSNISFGLPQRNNLNKAFLAMLIAAGADGAILDPCEEGMMVTLWSARAVLGLDEYGMEYITAHREGKLGA